MFKRVLSLLALTSLLLFFLSCLLSCKPRHFVRPGGEFDLGEVRHLLFAKQYLIDKSMLVHRDKTGWRVLSGRCTYDGCDLTYQEDTMMCSCCYSEFKHTGEVIKGPAAHPLPWYEIRYKDNHLYANSGKTVNPNYRFTTDEIEKRLTELREQIGAEGVPEGIEIPEVLLGKDIDDLNTEDDDLEPLPDENLSNMTDTIHSSSDD
ncbi:MAG: Rieske (2Fe-2S) protein [Deltaproteobacteria bacterium]|nr:Rieske (2Fe-2S) protein [Deltaproteobacteria bacterium]